MMLTHPLLSLECSAYGVVVLPDPVGPVTKIGYGTTWVSPLRVKTSPVHARSGTRLVARTGGDFSAYCQSITQVGYGVQINSLLRGAYAANVGGDVCSYPRDGFGHPPGPGELTVEIRDLESDAVLDSTSVPYTFVEGDGGIVVNVDGDELSAPGWLTVAVNNISNQAGKTLVIGQHRARRVAERIDVPELRQRHQDGEIPLQRRRQEMPVHGVRPRQQPREAVPAQRQRMALAIIQCREANSRTRWTNQCIVAVTIQRL